METIASILPWLIAAAIGVLYFFSRQKLNDLKEKHESLLDHKSHLIYSEQELELHKGAVKNSVRSEYHEILKKYQEKQDKLIEELEELKSKYANSVTIGYDGPSEPKYSSETFPYKFTSEIRSNAIELSVFDLISDQPEDVKKAFAGLVTANVFPVSISEKIDLDIERESVLIWARSFDEDGYIGNSFSWDTIISQILHKKQTLSDYLLKVIDDSNRAMVVSRVLTEKNKNGQEVNNA